MNQCKNIKYDMSPNQINNSLKKKKKKTNNSKEVLGFVQKYIRTAYTIFIVFLIICDYWIFTNVFNLNQAYFFNSIISNIINEQFIIIFILLPIFIVGLVLFLYIIKYEYFKKFEVKNYYFKSKSPILNTIKFIFYLLLLCIVDIVIYCFVDKLERFFEDINVIIFLLLIYFVYFWINFLTLLYLYSITSVINKNLQKIKVSVLIILSLFVLFKYYLLSTMKIDLDDFEYFIMFNVFIFILLNVYIRLNQSDKDQLNSNNDSPFVISVLTLFFSIVLVDNLEQLQYSQYTDKEYWEKSVYKNSLSKFNVSLFLNSLKVTKSYDNTKINNLFKKDILKEILKTKDIEIELEEYFVSDIDIFYLPKGKNQFVFIYKKENNKVLVLYVSNDYQKLHDIGYIKLKS